ncbi:nucleotide-binding domain containing protein, partial [Mangrovicoccus algicola]|nr:hypothetical protein [Mangrovicoccus algicola]
CPGTAPRPAPPPGLPLLIAIGSRDPVTLAQVAALPGIPHVAAPNGALPGPLPVAPVTVVQMTPGPAPVPPRQAAAQFAAGLARQVAAAPPAMLLVTGGETADAILSGLGAGLLVPEGELAPGLPAMRLLDGPTDLRLATKSGGFGAPGLLAGIVAAAV